MVYKHLLGSSLSTLGLLFATFSARGAIVVEKRGWREMGAASAVEASGVLTNRARRALGIEAVRGHARLKLDRLAAMSGDVDEGAARRERSRNGMRYRRDAYSQARGPRVFTHRHHSNHGEW